MSDVPENIRDYIGAELRKIQRTLDTLTQGDTVFPPVINGLTTAGVGTYTVQSAVYTRIGQLIIARFAFGVTNHTGTGALTIPLPVKAQVGIGHGGCSTNLGAVQDVSLASTIGPTGVLVLQTPGPAQANIAMPGVGVSFTLNVTFVYVADNAA